MLNLVKPYYVGYNSIIIVKIYKYAIFNYNWAHLVNLNDVSKCVPYSYVLLFCLLSRGI